jgi:hypothetical protein
MDSSNLKQIKTELLRKIILNSPRRPIDYTVEELYDFLDYTKHSEKELKDVLQLLIDEKQIEEENGNYALSRQAFLGLKKEYKARVFLNSELGRLFIPGLISLMMLVFVIIELPFISREKSDVTSKNEIQIRMNDLEEKYDSLFFLLKRTEIIKDSSKRVAYTDEDLDLLKSQYTKLSENFMSLNNLLQNDPIKFLEIATIKKDIEDQKLQMNNNNEALKREVDRISSYNNTLTAFMITFLVSYIGIGVFNAISRKNKV